MLGMSYLYEERFASQEGLWFLELVNFAVESWFFRAFTLKFSDSLLLSKQTNAPMYRELMLQKAATNIRHSAL